MSETPKTLVLTDCHGCHYTMVRLLNTAATPHPGARLILLGNLIDRGPHSRAVVEFAMANKVPTTAGNHESLALAFSAHKGYDARCAVYYDRDVWLYNGGDITLANWQPDETRWREGLPKEVLDWMVSLPPYLITDAVDERGRRGVLSHTGFGLDADLGTKDGWFKALWGRHPDDDDFPQDGYYRVFGHCREHVPRIAEDHCMLDTGAAYKSYGTLTAFVWPTKELVQQAFDESPVEARFRVNGGCIIPIS